MKILNYCDYEPFQQVFRWLPLKDGEVLEAALREFFQAPECMGCDGTEEVGSVSSLNGFLNDNFLHMKALWQMGTYGDSNYVLRLEHAIDEVNCLFGFDAYGTRRIQYHRHPEFREIYKHLPQELREHYEQQFYCFDMADEDFALRDDDGYLEGEKLMLWFFREAPEAAATAVDLLVDLTKAMPHVDKKVRAARAEAFDRGELPYEDGKRPPAVLVH